MKTESLSETRNKQNEFTCGLNLTEKKLLQCRHVTVVRGGDCKGTSNRRAAVSKTIKSANTQNVSRQENTTSFQALTQV